MAAVKNRNGLINMDSQVNKLNIYLSGKLFMIIISCTMNWLTLFGQAINNEKVNISLLFKPQIFIPVIGNVSIESVRYPSNVIMTTYDVNRLPFFCKIEHRIERSGKIPFRFRLGDLNYVNMLENKR
jgi:hypothetical protein